MTTKPWRVPAGEDFSLVQRRQAASIESRGISQRFPFWCNKTKTSRTAGRRSSWSPSRHHRQSLWQARTNFSQDKCTRCSPSKWPIVGALPAQYLGRGPRPRFINRLATTEERDPDPILPKRHRLHKNSSPREAVLPLYCSSSAPEAIHHTTN